MFLKRFDSCLRSCAKDAVHRGRRNFAVVLAHFGQPELYLLHRVAPVAQAQGRAGINARHKVSVGLFTLAGQLGKVFDRYINVADFVPGRTSNNAVRCQVKLLLELLHHIFGVLPEDAVGVCSAKERVVLRNAVQLALNDAHAFAAVAFFQRGAGVAAGDGGNVIRPHQL